MDSFSPAPEPPPSSPSDIPDPPPPTLSYASPFDVEPIAEIDKLVDSLENIVDATEELAECREWIREQFEAGVDADSILAQLIAKGWVGEVAESAVEEGRRATRHLRGVITRDQVAQIAERRYRNAFKFAFRLAIGGIPVMGAYFIASLFSRDRIPKLNRKG